MNGAGAIDSANWTSADVGYETFKIPPNMKIHTAVTLTCMNLMKTSIFLQSDM